LSPGRLNLRLVSGVGPEHEAVLGVEGDRRWVVQLAANDLPLVAAVVLRDGDDSSRRR
jgi:hypothetical protein